MSPATPPDPGGAGGTAGGNGSANGDGIVDPRFDRFRPLSNALGWALLAVTALAGLAVVLPRDLAVWAGAALVALLVAVPMARVVWLVLRWFRRGDRRYAFVGVGVLAVIAVGAVLGLLGA